MIINTLLRNKVTSSIINQGLKIYRILSANLVDYKYEEAENPSFDLDSLKAYNKHRKLGAKKELCLAPKSSMFFSFSGEVLMCSQNRIDVLGNVNKNTLKEIWFNDIRYNLDKKINQDYNLKDGCYRCEMSIKSKDYNSLYSQNNDFHIGKPGVFPKRMGFELHNTCNLECVMCNGEFSSAIRINREKRKPSKFVYTDEFLQQLDEFIPHLKYADFVGGEPTLIIYYYQIIEKIIALNPRCLIHIQTNGTVLKERFKNALKKGNFEIGISIDSLDEQIMKSIRKNIIWKDFRGNLDYYLEESRHNRIKLTVNFCPMPVNWTQIIPIVEFCNNHKLPVYFCMVESPYQQSFLSTSSAFIDNVINELSDKNLTGNSYYEYSNIKQLKSFIQLLHEWKSKIISKEKIENELLKYDNTELKLRYKEFLNERIHNFSDKDYLLKLYEYTLQNINDLSEETQKRVLILLINTFDAPIYFNNEESMFDTYKYDLVQYIDYVKNKMDLTTSENSVSYV